MYETDLERLLYRVGMRVFVQYFKEFSDPTLSGAEVVDLLPSEFTLKSRRSRTAKARRIIREGWQAEALSMIAKSEKVEPDLAEQAAQLLTWKRLRPRRKNLDGIKTEAGRLVDARGKVVPEDEWSTASFLHQADRHARAHGHVNPPQPWL